MARTDVSTLRSRVGQALWLICVLFALILAIGALLIALQGSGTNPDNGLYKFVVNTGDWLDFGVLSRKDGLFDFVGKNGQTKDALANWGLAAIVWLVIGRVADRVVRP
jgi:hypothetical protein